MTNPVVNVSVSVQTAPAPSTLQKTGALISQGATVTSPGTSTRLAQSSDLTPILRGARAISSISWAGGTVSVTTSTAHGYTVGDTLPITIAGCAPTGYNGTFDCTVTSPTAFTYPLTDSPGAMTTAGVYTVEDVAELLAMVTTFFAQGSAQSVYVLECGPGDAADGVAFLDAWLGENSNVYYSYLVPRYWDADADFLAFLAEFEATDSKTYFFVTTTLATYQNYSGKKCVLWMIEAPVYGTWSANDLTAIIWSGGIVTATTETDHGVEVGDWFQIAGCVPTGYNGWAQAIAGTTGDTLVWELATNPGSETALGTLLASQYASTGIPSTEFSMASEFRVTLNYAPSSTNKVTTLNFAYVFGVTTFPTQGNSTLISTLLAANGNLIGTGAQGGISESLVRGGKMADGHQFKYWYSIDWAQINLSRNVTAVLINGSNNPANPVDYNQPGINSLQQSIVSTMSTGIANGLVLNPIKATTLSATDFQTALDNNVGFTLVNADPFASYVAENPDDYSSGTYNGLSVDYVPQQGFESVTINVTIDSFAG